ncbi:MAG: glutamate--tRNA ligase [Flavobacteriales bacterium]|nr:glutamate--tRNA ligase [Flavobacteriales bacterium]
MKKEVRVRFAPSPTGPLHIGGVRTALYNYLFAKKNNGKFILRIEDTDSSRFVEGAQQYIEESFQWCGISFDESPKLGGEYGSYIQSERTELYNKYIQNLLDTGNAYYAFDTPEELDELRKEYEKENRFFSYNSQERKKLKNSLNLNQEQVSKLLEEQVPYVIRFKIPENRNLVLNDIIRGTFSVDTNTLDDKVLMKADGIPTYHFANVVDDYLMKISHVIRGEEWLPSLPLHTLLYESFGWESPTFAHLPLILKPIGNGKLSKRDGDKFGFPVFPFEWKDEKTGEISQGYREQGYFADAFLNMLALLGWTPSEDKEILTLEQMIQEFDLEKVHKSGAHFNIEKTKWINKEYLQKKSTDELLKIYQKYLKNISVDTSNADRQIVEILKERVHFVHEIYQEGFFFYEQPKTLEEKSYKKVWKEDTAEIISEFLLALDNVEWNQNDIKNAITEYSKQKEIGLGRIMAPLRLLLVGEMKGPDVPVIMEILGKNEVIARIEKQIK